MKRIIAFIAVIFMVPICSAADVMIRTQERTETYVGDTLEQSKQGGENFFWYGDEKVAYITPRWTIILNRAEKKFIMINPRRKTYVESSIPLDMEKMLGEDLKKRYATEKTTGTVEKTGGTRTMLDLACTEYQVKYWTVRGGEKINMRDIKVWAAEHEKVDLSLHDDLLHWLRKIYNRDEKLRKELQKINGVQMRLEMADRRDGKGVKYIEEVVEIVEKEAPPQVYAAPDGYEKVQRISSQDF